MQRVLVTTDLPSWDLQLRSDPFSFRRSPGGSEMAVERLALPRHDQLLPGSVTQQTLAQRGRRGAVGGQQVGGHFHGHFVFGERSALTL